MRTQWRRRRRCSTPSPARSTYDRESCPGRAPPASAAFFGRPQKYQQAPTPMAAALAIELTQAERGRLITARRKRIQTSAVKQRVRETCSVPGPADGSDTGARSPAGCARFSVLDFLLAAQSAAATTIP